MLQLMPLKTVYLMLVDNEVFMSFVMHWEVICVVLFGIVFSGISCTPKEKVHIKIHVPYVVHRHNHKKIIVHKLPKLLDKPPIPHRAPIKPPPPVKKPVKPHHYVKTVPYVFKPYEDNYHHSYKTIKSEKYETEVVSNPFSTTPDDKYIVKGKYKVREKLPFNEDVVGYDKNYHYPLSEGEHNYEQSKKAAGFGDVGNPHTDVFVPAHYELLKAQEEDEGAKFKDYFEAPQEDEGMQFKPSPVLSSNYDEFKPVTPTVSADYEFAGDLPEGNVDPHEPPPFEKVQKQGKKQPKAEEANPNNFSYQYPADDYEYNRNVGLINYYINKSNAEASNVQEETPKFQDYGFNQVDYEYDMPKADSETYSTFVDGNDGPSDPYEYYKYKTEGSVYGF